MDSAARTAIAAAVDRELAKLRTISDDIHANPELGFEETRAAEWLIAFLRDTGFDVETPVAGLATAFRATCGSGSPVVAFQCEYDALPEIGHGCGHNLIAVAGLAAGLGLKALIDDLGGTVVVLGTPGEEGLGGKVQMIREGVYDDVDFALMTHPSTNDRDDTGCTAVQRVRISFHGQTAHAAASPEKGINALDGILLTYAGINALRQHIREDSRIHGIVTEGGLKPNITPDRAEAIFYVRSPIESYLTELLQKVENVARGAALMTGAECEFELTGNGYRSRVPCPVLTRLFHGEAELLGFDFKPKFGPGRGSSDSGDVSWIVPAVHPYFKIADEATPGHSVLFTDAAVTDAAFDAAINSGKAMAAAAATVISEPALLGEMKSLHDERTS